MSGEDLRLDAYYYGFDATGIREIDLILSAVASAGRAYHHTEHWADEQEGDTEATKIQRAANAAAVEVTRLIVERDAAERIQADLGGRILAARAVAADVAGHEQMLDIHATHCPLCDMLRALAGGEVGPSSPGYDEFPPGIEAVLHPGSRACDACLAENPERYAAFPTICPHRRDDVAEALRPDEPREKCDPYEHNRLVQEQGRCTHPWHDGQPESPDIVEES